MISTKRLIIIKTLQIQRHWRKCTYDPSFKLAQRLITNRLKINLVKIFYQLTYIFDYNKVIFDHYTGRYKVQFNTIYYINRIDEYSV